MKQETNPTDISYTYILCCGDGSYYTGWTNDLARRLAAHRSGKGSRYTGSHLPVRLVYYEEYETRREAMKREAAIKKLTRRDKEHLVASLEEEEKKRVMACLNGEA